MRVAFAAALGLGLTAADITGCASGPAFVTAPEAPAPPRQPDGVVVEPDPAVPATVSRGEARGVIVLREPRELTPFRDLAYAYVRALQKEDLDAAVALMTMDAVPLFTKGRPTRAGLIEGLRSRLRSLDYAQIAGVDPLEADELRVLDYDELGGEWPRPPEMRTTDVLVRVPVAVGRLGSDRYFGAVLILAVRREEGRLKITGVGDDDR